MQSSQIKKTFQRSETPFLAADTRNLMHLFLKEITIVDVQLDILK